MSTDTLTSPDALTRAGTVRHTGAGQTRLRDLRTLADLAHAAGVKPDTISAYRTRGYLPEPIGYVADVPVWSRAQMESWLASRPGQGRKRA